MQTKFTKEEIYKYADKLLIGLTEEENEMVLKEFDVIDKNISLINNIPNIENVDIMSHCLDDFEFDLREDTIEESTDIDDLLSNCDNYRNNEVKVPKVVE